MANAKYLGKIWKVIKGQQTEPMQNVWIIANNVN